MPSALVGALRSFHAPRVLAVSYVAACRIVVTHPLASAVGPRSVCWRSNAASCCRQFAWQRLPSLPTPAPCWPACCAGVLGEHLPDLLEDPDCLQEVLPALPSEAKAALLAVARLRRLLCDAALAALADEGHALLDLSSCGAALTEAGICAALRRMPHLRAADLRSCLVGGATLRTLGEACPALEVLRLGSPFTDGSATAARCCRGFVPGCSGPVRSSSTQLCMPPTCAPQGAAGPQCSPACCVPAPGPRPCRALADILPVPQERQQAPAADSWDALLGVEDARQLSAAVGGVGRLMQLQCLCWPNIPFRAEQHCRQACPRVALNPTADEVAARRLPPECDPGLQLDASLLAGGG